MPEEEELPRLLSGRYRLESTLGQGGMGVVYRGTDLTMKRAIAVKLVRSADGNELDDEIAGRFLREAKNTARLQHEHIIEVFDLGRTDNGDLYFVMELLDGESLASRLRRRGRLSPAETVHIARQICDGLEAAHAAGVIHRDLKPANVMLLSRAGVQDYVKVLDFGVAKALGSADQQTQLTHTGMLVGTVDYMAPEQITGKGVDGRTDMYSLGIVLYRMLSGAPPFRDTGVPALIHAHLNTMPKPLIEVSHDIPNELDRVVLRCLAKNPDRRYGSMAELSRALRASLEAAEAYERAPVPERMPTPAPPARVKPAETARAKPSIPPPPAVPAMPPPITDRPKPMPPLAPTERPRGKAPKPVSVPPPVAPPRGATGLVDLAYDASDPYASDAQTRVARSALPDNEDGDATLMQTNHTSLPPEDATLMMDRSVPPARPSAPAAYPPGTPRNPAMPPGAPGPWGYQEDIATATRQAFQGGPQYRLEPRLCGMCQTMNPPHARACQACGMTLAAVEHVATGPRQPAFTHPGYAQQGRPWPPQPAPPPNIWQRFLTWTGLRGR